MSKVYYVTHPKVVIDPNIPDTEWQISEEGYRQLEHLMSYDFIKDIGVVYSSSERKARDAAIWIAEKIDVEYKQEDLSGSNRSKAGWLEKDDNAEAIATFYSQPDAEPFGWESWTSVQRRNAETFQRINSEVAQDKNILIVAHGDGGTTLLCHLLGVPMSRNYDQPVPSCYWVYDRNTQKVTQQWKPYSTITSGYTQT